MAKRCVVRVGICALAIWAGTAEGQTRVDLKNQSRAVDFSEATSTKPAKSGSALPSSCTTGEMYFLTTAVPGSNLYACTATDVWSLQSGSAAATALNTLAISRTSDTVLTVGASCSTSAPCNIRTGASTYSFSSSATVTLTAGTGTAYVYISSAGVLTVGHNVSVTCAGGCVAQSGVMAFPADSIPIASWSASAAVWLTSGGADRRSFLSKDFITVGSGLVVTSGTGYPSLGVDQAVVGLRTTVPSSASGTCTAGAWAADTSYYYLCVAASTWKRAALSSW